MELFFLLSSVKTKGLIGPPALRVWVGFRPVSRLGNHPHLTRSHPRLLGFERRGARGGITLVLVVASTERREPGVCRDAGTLCPCAPHPGLRLSRALPRAGRPSYFSTKGLRCIAFFGVKPSPGQSEISAFFRSIVTQKV